MNRTCHLKFPSIVMDEKIKNKRTKSRAYQYERERTYAAIAATIENKWSVDAMDGNEIDLTSNTRHLSIIGSKRTNRTRTTSISYERHWTDWLFCRKESTYHWHLHVWRGKTNGEGDDDHYLTISDDLIDVDDHFLLHTLKDKSICSRVHHWMWQVK